LCAYLIDAPLGLARKDENLKKEFVLKGFFSE